MDVIYQAPKEVMDFKSNAWFWMSFTVRMSAICP